MTYPSERAHDGCCLLSALRAKVYDVFTEAPKALAEQVRVCNVPWCGEGGLWALIVAEFCVHLWAVVPWGPYATAALGAAGCEIGDCARACTSIAG